LADRYALPERGFLEVEARLQREPDNPVDAEAVAIVVEGEKVGNLPSYAARSFPLPEGASVGVPYQLHVLRGEKWAGKAFVWLGRGKPQWMYSASNPPPLASRERTLATAKRQSHMVKEALEGGGERAQQFQRGMYQGVHYLQLIEPIKQLKRENRLEEALALCYQAINGAEQDREGREPAPWYTEQAAIVHRKLGENDQEIAVLERWLNITPPDRRSGSAIAERHQKCLQRRKKNT
jgi:tetratricopeptide (TPR) repeat protein